MKLNLSKFKKLREDRVTATLRHPAGHEIKIAKKSLSKDLQSELSSLPMHMEDGGNVPDLMDEEEAPEAPAIEQSASDQKPVNVIINNGPQPPAIPMQPAAEMAVPPQPTQASPQAPSIMAPNPQMSAQPSMQEIPQQAYFSGLQQQKEGQQAEAEAIGNQGKEEAEYLRQGVDQQQQQMKDYQDHLGELQKEYAGFIQDVQKEHIDSAHYLNSMGAGKKIATGIGLILGGMGGGLTHQGNPVLDFLNKQIVNDIDSQKANMSNKQTLLSANLRQFGNLRDATQMTQAMQMGIVSNQLKMAAAKAQEPMAKARALQASGQLDSQATGMLQQLAARRYLMDQMQPQDGGTDPARKILLQKQMGIMSETEAKDAMKELKEVQDQTKARDNALHTFDQLSKINTLMNRVTSPMQTSRQAEALRDNLAVQIARAAAGRVNEYEFEAAKKLFPSPGDDEDTSKQKLSALKAFMNEKMNAPNLESRGININQMGRFTPEGKNRFAESAPNVK